MRRDFQKLLCECSRHGPSRSETSKKVRAKLKHSRNSEDGEYYSTDKRIRRKIIGWDAKEFGENLKPLERFIGKQVGKPWDKVYSEICKFNKKNGAVGLHIFQHLYGYIETKCIKDEDGTVRTAEAYGWGHRELTFGDIYVDPDDGIIKRYRRGKRYTNRDRKAARQNREPTEYALTPDEKLVQEDGIWYLIEYGMIEKYWYYEHEQHETKRYGVVRKKQLNSKELKDYGLKNAA